MAKITLSPITGSYASVTAINARYQQIEDVLNDNVFWRVNVTGEPNLLANDLDMASNSLINLAAPVNNTDAARLQDILDSASALSSITAVLTSISDAGGYYTSDNVEGALAEIGINRTEAVSNKAEAITLSIVNGKMYSIGNTGTAKDEGLFKGVTGATPGTYIDDGGLYNGAMIIPSGGDGSSALLRLDGGYNVGFGHNVKWYGVTGGGTTDESVTGQAAANAATSKLFFPDGVYSMASASISMSSNISIYGESREGTIIQGDFLFGSKGMFYYESTTVGDDNNIKGVHISDLTLYGKVDVDGYSGFTHLLSFYGVSDAVIERVTFKGQRGDAIYLGGKTVAGSVVRHNKNITIRDSLIDGLVKDNRNGISIIDVEGLLVENCWLKNIGNAASSSSVAAIDLEPNDTFSVCRSILIDRCIFEDIDTVNTAGFTYFNTQQSGDNIKDVTLSNCTFNRCYRGFDSSTQSKTLSSESDNIKIIHCSFINSTVEDINGLGIKNFTIADNSFELTPINSSSYRGGVHVGGTSEPAIGWDVSNNIFSGLRPQFGCIVLSNVRGLTGHGNKFENIEGRSIALNDEATGGTDRYMEGLDLQFNQAISDADDHSTGAAANLGLLSQIGTFGQSFMSYTNIFKNNTAFGRVDLIRSGVTEVFNGQPLAAAPTTGTWTQGSGVDDTVPSAGAARFVCDVAGTFGTLTSVTGDVVNGSRTVTNVVDATPDLREGQFITLTGSATVHYITLISGSTVYLDSNFGGATLVGAAIAYSAPTFVVV